MTQGLKTRVFTSGGSQHVTIPAQYHLTTGEVYVRRDDQTGDLILSQTPASWDDIYAALDDPAFPDSFLADRNQGIHPLREDL